VILTLTTTGRRRLKKKDDAEETRFALTEAGAAELDAYAEHLTETHRRTRGRTERRRAEAIARGVMPIASRIVAASSMAEDLAVKLALEFGEAYVDRKIALLRVARDVDDRARWLYCAIVHDFKPSPYMERQIAAAERALETVTLRAAAPAAPASQIAAAQRALEPPAPDTSKLTDDEWLAGNSFMRQRFRDQAARDVLTPPTDPQYENLVRERMRELARAFRDRMKAAP
jgi:hypothetical protein